MRDMISNIQNVRGAVQTLSGATPNNSALIDRRGFDALTVYVETGTVTDAGDANGFTMKLQHSNSTAAGTFVDVPAAGLVAGPGGATTVQVVTDGANGITAGGVGYVGDLRYVRAVFTGTTGTNATVQVVGILGKPHRAPAATVGATVAAT